jgi:hypothetical protein
LRVETGIAWGNRACFDVSSFPELARRRGLLAASVIRFRRTSDTRESSVSQITGAMYYSASEPRQGITAC